MLHFFYRQSLSTVLSIIIFIIVSAIISLYTVSSYTTTRENALNEIHINSTLAVQSLKKNLSSYIASYALNDYTKLIATEMETHKYLAIIVDDHNMAELLGKPEYIVGQIRINGEIHNYDPADPVHQKAIESNYLGTSEAILLSDGSTIGGISIYMNNEKLNSQLKEILKNNLFGAFLLISGLIASILLALEYVFIKPMQRLATRINNTSSDGIPKEFDAIIGVKEITLLSVKINRMITKIKESSLELKDEKERFALAIEGTLDGLWDWNLITNIMMHSDRFETMLGYDIGELPDTIDAWSQLLHPEDIQSAFTTIDQYLSQKGEGMYQSVYRMRTKSGEYCWIQGRGKALFDSEGRAVRFVGFNTDITEEMEQKQHLEYYARHDVLTSLPNRYLFNELFSQMISRCIRNKSMLALLYIDLDGFKDINDIHGHNAGDYLLQVISKRMQKNIRDEDILARIGGDEFVIALTDFQAIDEIINLLKRLITDINLPIHYANDNHQLIVSASIGVTTCRPTQKIDIPHLIQQADDAMYKAKENGKNRYYLA